MSASRLCPHGRFIGMICLDCDPEGHRRIVRELVAMWGWARALRFIEKSVQLETEAGDPGGFWSQIRIAYAQCWTAGREKARHGECPTCGWGALLMEGDAGQAECRLVCADCRAVHNEAGDLLAKQGD